MSYGGCGVLRWWWCLMVVVVSYGGGGVFWWLGCLMVVVVSYGGWGVLWWLWYRILYGGVGGKSVIVVVLNRTL